MRLGILKSNNKNETRIAALPETVKKYINLGFKVYVESGIGSHLHISDEAYTQTGALISNSARELLPLADMAISITPIERKMLKSYQPGCWQIGFFNPFGQSDLLKEIAKQQINLISLEMLPRSTVAQPMDALSSQANLAGYASVLQACQHSLKVLPMMMTAAGTIAPAKVLIIGVGVAGLQAIATAKRLGAQVTAYDVRPAVEEQVKSLGAKFLKIDVGEAGQTKQGYAKELTAKQLQKQQELMLQACIQSDIIITTALIFGKPAPTLITEAMLQKLKPGTVVVDMATEAGGNVERSVKDAVVDYQHIKIVGLSQPARTVANDASLMYGNNIYHLIHFFWDTDSKKMHWNLEDEMLRSCVLTYNGEIVHPNFIAREVTHD